MRLYDSEGPRYQVVEQLMGGTRGWPHDQRGVARRAWAIFDRDQYERASAGDALGIPQHEWPTVDDIIVCMTSTEEHAVMVADALNEHDPALLA